MSRPVAKSHMVTHLARKQIPTMNRTTRHALIVCAAAGLLAPPAALRAAELKLAAVFSDHMVLQRDMSVPVWGWANAGDKVTVEFAGQNKTATADANGKWLVKLEAMSASAVPRLMKVNRTVIADVLVGEVWLASGQSNMGYTLSPKYDAKAIAAADHPELRCFTVENEGALTPQDAVKGRWQVSSPKTAPGFTAVGYYFAEELRRELGVPVGILHSSVGGTQAESWLSREAQAASPLLKDYSERQIDAMAHFEEDAKSFQKALPEWEAKYGAGDAGNVGFGKGWAKEDFNDSDWQTCPAPVWWRQLGLKGGCIIWLRKTVDIPADKAGKGAVYGFVGYSEDVTPYFNGQELKPCWPKPPRFFTWWAYYNVPGSLVKAGRNVIALRVHSHTEDGLMWRKPKEILDIADQATTDDTWRYRLEARFPDLTPEARASLPKAPQAQMNNTASALFNGKINPLIPFALRGAIWYQGESNVGRAAGYAPLLSALIHDWRTR
jgi:sialate O-acetylesterase